MAYNRFAPVTCEFYSEYSNYLNSLLADLEEEYNFITENAADFHRRELWAMQDDIICQATTIRALVWAESGRLREEEEILAHQEINERCFARLEEIFESVDEDFVDVESVAVVDVPALPAAIESDEVVVAEPPVENSWLDDYYYDIPEPQFEDDTPDAEWLDEEFDAMTTPSFSPSFSSYLSYLIWLITSIYEQLRTSLSYFISLGYSPATSS